MNLVMMGTGRLEAYNLVSRFGHAPDAPPKRIDAASTPPVHENRLERHCLANCSQSSTVR